MLEDGPVQLFATDNGVIERLVQNGIAVPETTRLAFEAHYVPDEMPFLIDGDGTYMHLVNDFLRALPPHRAPPRTWIAYARDVSSLLAFLRSTSRCDDLLRVGFADLRAFHGHEMSRGLGPGSWNRKLAGLENFFSWALGRGRRADKPFKHFEGKARQYRGRTTQLVNTLCEPVSPSDEVKCVTKREYQVFRDVGLRGFKKDGRTRDPSFRGHNGDRNGLLADYLVETGMRKEEGLSLLVAELPKDALNVHGGSISTRLAAATT